MVRTCMCISAKHQQTLMIRDRVSLSRVSDHTHTEYFLSTVLYAFYGFTPRAEEQDGAQTKSILLPGCGQTADIPKKKTGDREVANREPTLTLNQSAYRGTQHIAYGSQHTALELDDPGVESKVYFTSSRTGGCKSAGAMSKHRGLSLFGGASSEVRRCNCSVVV
jgi:hypothetical protein